MSKLDLVCFDADDTLWHNLIHFDAAEEEFAKLMAAYMPAAQAKQEIIATESHNVRFYGYGVKSFTLSMIETAIRISGGTVGNETISKLIMMGRDMLDHDIELLPHVEETLRALHGRHRLLLITKGDLMHQQNKVLASGLAHYFEGVEIVADKLPATYEKIAVRFGTKPSRMLMAGNSVKSDVLPMITAGGYGVHVPFAITWEHEHEEVPPGTDRYFAVKDLRGVIDVVRELAG